MFNLSSNSTVSIVKGVTLDGPRQSLEEAYRLNTLGILDILLYDVRHVLRRLGKNPAFSAAAILTLAVGIGANTAIFSIADAVLIRPLPYRQPEALIGVFNSAVIQGEPINHLPLAPGMYTALKQDSAAFEQFGVWSAGTAVVTGTGDPEQISTVVMTRGLLPALGAQPLLGRAFSVEDDRQGAPETVILSHSYWQRRFGLDPKVLGRTVLLDFKLHQVIGVMPPQFRFLDLAPDVLLPQRFRDGDLSVEPWLYNGIARLKPGLAIDFANRDAARVLNNWSKSSIPDNMRRIYEQFQVRPALRPLKRDVVGDAGSVLEPLMGALALMLMLICANVANLVLVRAQARNQEFAIRAALGASPRKIASELLEESMMLGLLGGACGIALAYGAVRILKAQDLTGIPRLAEVSIDARALAFALACAIAASMGFGLIAAWKFAIPGKLVGARGASMRVEQLRTHNLLVVVQIALALVLLVASGLLTRSVLAMRAVHPGFTHPEHIQTSWGTDPGHFERRLSPLAGQLMANLTRLPTRLSISTSVSIVNLAVFLFTTSDTRGRDTIRIWAASACLRRWSAIQVDNSSINCCFSRRVSLICL